MAAARRPPRSDPQNNQDFRLHQVVPARQPRRLLPQVGGEVAGPFGRTRVHGHAPRGRTCASLSRKSRAPPPDPTGAQRP
jgi:hypothetical protein